MNVETLLSDIAALSPSARTARVVLVSRGLRESDPRSLDVMLDELSAGDVYARRLAVTMAAATGQGHRLAQAAFDEEPAVAALAVAADPLPDQVVLDVLRSGPMALRRLVLRRLRRDRREDLAAACLPVTRERWGDQEAATLLAACDEETVRRSLPDLSYAVTSWTALATRHPDLVADHATDELGARTGTAAQRWWWEQPALVAALLEVRPAVVLSLAENHLATEVPPVLRQGLSTLLRVDPTRVVVLLAAHPDRAREVSDGRLSRRARARLAQVPQDDLARLLRAAAARQDLRLTRQVLRAVPPSRRSALLDAVWQGVAVDTLEIDEDVLALLPWARRQAEARRMLALPHVAARQERVWGLSAYLPVDEAVPVLEQAVRSTDADQRALGYRLLIRNAALNADTQRVTELLGWLVRMRNERDPVRQAVLFAVAELPFELITAAALPALDRLVTETVNARDASAASSSAAARLAFRVLWLSGGRSGADADELARWALTTVERLGAWQAHAMVPGLDLARMLRPGQEQQLWQHVRGPARQALLRNDAWPVLWFARLLGRRAWNLPELQDLLADAIGVRNDGVMREAVTLWLSCPATRAARVAWLVDAESSTATIPAVLDVLVTARTDLLERHVLTGKKLTGRLAPRGVWVPVIDRHRQQRWTSHQQALYRRLLRIGAVDTKAGRWSQAVYAKALATAPGVAPADVADLLAGDDVLVTEAVLTGLGNSDSPERALHLLAAHLDDDRARVATYALSRCTRWVAPERLTGLLTDLLRNAPKVVVRKEAARLIAVHHLVDGIEALVAAAQAPDAHRDVRIAVLSSLIGFPGDPRIWAALQDAASGPDPDVAKALLAASWTTLPPAARSPYAQLVCVVVGRLDGAAAGYALATLPDWYQWAVPQVRAVIHQSLTDLDRRDTWRAAASAASDPAAWTVDPTLPTYLATALMARLDEGPDADPTRDLPARQRLDNLLLLFGTRARAIRAHPQAAEALADAVATHGLPVAAAQLHLLLVVPGPAAQRHLTRAADLLADRPVAAHRLAWQLASQMPAGDWAVPGTDELITSLLDRGDPVAGRFALTLIFTAGELTSWNHPWDEHLRTLRRRHDPDLRDAALATRTAPE